MLPLYGDEDFIMCDLALAKCNSLAHAMAVQSGISTVWADEDTESQESQMERTRDIIRNNYKFRE